MSTETIYENLKHIINDPSPPPRFPVAALTCDNRVAWASMRRAIETVPDNKSILTLIDSAVFVLCFDDNELNSIADITRTCLHGDGRNR